MNKPRLLIVVDDKDIANMLQVYFSGYDFEVETCSSGFDAFDKIRRNLPHLILLDTLLPDIDGFEICRRLRSNTRTSNVPIFFLAQNDERKDRLLGFESGADDYIDMPFDIEELMLRVQRAITRSEFQSLTDPRSGLPSGRLIEEQLRRVIRQKGWSFLDIRINHFEPFKDVYGFVAGDDVLRLVAMLINEVVSIWGNHDDFIGHTGGYNFVIITSQKAAPKIIDQLGKRFREEILSHYSFMDREQGFIVTSEGGEASHKAPLMTLSVGEASPARNEFADIREITELAAVSHRQSG